MSLNTALPARSIVQFLGINTLRLFVIIVLLFLGIILWDIFSKGFAVINSTFLLDYPRRGMMEGGIFPAIAGTTFVTLVTTLFAIPFGICAAIYLSEYAIDNTLNRFIRAAIRNLAGVPSIIYGLFGVAVFVQGAALGASILSSGLTLGLLTLPYIITTTEEALKNVPQSYREGAMALGATRWEAIRTNVLPGAVSGIVTGAILGLSRAAGETAPILFTGVAFYLRYLPSSVHDEFMALPYHLYILSTQHHAIAEVRPLAYGTAVVLLGLVFLLNILAFIIRYRYRKFHNHQV
ncbi:MAG TPA: phosphate ABC transporter permease PstA [Saprospiraceae bacterium]|nr:phosphate ABC transporter permease PstA [Saprospiraceae bacterium]HMP25721.1 phosphate ABC transporter permease PstA [Saprospiraceae bacterium]